MTTLTYTAGDEQRVVRATAEGGQWVVLDELGDDRRVVERVDADGEAAAIVRDYAAQASAAGHPLVGGADDRDRDA